MITEPTRVPWAGIVFGYAAMIPIVAGTLGVWLFTGTLADATLRLTLVWASAIVAFLAGVRRGLSFRAPDGETAGQIATSLWLFALGFGAILLVPHPAAAAVLLVGFFSLAVFDTLAARREETPPYFARLRPWQMSIPVLCMIAILLRGAF